MADEKEQLHREKGHLKNKHHLQQILPSVKKPLTQEFFSFTKQFSIIRMNKMIVMPTKQRMIVAHVCLWKVHIVIQSVIKVVTTLNLPTMMRNITSKRFSRA